jgi:DNA (cytosine-5)-methyltransferase 1
MRNNDGALPTGFDEPVGTLTGKGHQSVVTMPYLVDYHGQGTATAVTQPMGVVDTRDRRALVLPEVNVDDCGFRMLEPHEIKAAMAFPASYRILGNKREQVKQCGNAVTPPVSRTILSRVIASLQGREV